MSTRDLRPCGFIAIPEATYHNGWVIQPHPKAGYIVYDRRDSALTAHLHFPSFAEAVGYVEDRTEGGR